jgi:hypothetical protein
MKNKSCIFAAFFTTELFLILGCVAIFFATYSAVNAVTIRLHSSVDCCTSKVSNCSVVRIEEGSLSLLKYFNFSFTMLPQNNEDYSSTNNSNANVTPDSAKTVSYEAFKIEMDAKNKAYYFIISHGLIDKFTEFCRNPRLHSGNPHADCLNALCNQMEINDLFSEI